VRKLNADLEAQVAERTAELAERAKDLASSNLEFQQLAMLLPRLAGAASEPLPVHANLSKRRR